MGKTDRVEARPWQRPIALALVVLWSVVGVLPGLHRHGSEMAVDSHDSGACDDSRLTASEFLEPQESTHTEACGLCAKLSSFEGLERPRALLVGDPVAECAATLSSTKPPVSSGRHGTARAPPLV